MDKYKFIVLKRTLIVLIILLGLISFTGIYKNNEHGDYYFFIKHRPICKFYFSATERELNNSSLTMDEKENASYYIEFVKNKKYELYIPIP